MKREAWLIDGTPVYIEAEEICEGGIRQYRVRPRHQRTFDSGVNPWVRASAVLDSAPDQEVVACSDPTS